MTTLEVPALAGSSLTSQIEVGEHLSFHNDSPPKNWVVWRIMTPKDGDRRIVWNPDSFTEINEARDLFRKLIKAGMVPYICDAQGKPTGEIMDVFDPLDGMVSFQDVVWAPKKLAVGG